MKVSKQHSTFNRGRLAKHCVAADVIVN